jgi:alpha-mannosidase
MKRVKKLSVLLCFVLSVTASMYAHANADSSKNEILVQGYAKSLQGATISYNSHLRGSHNALIIRAQKGMNEIGWTTEEMPKQFGGKFVDVVWNAGVSGVQAGKEKENFDISVNGRKVVTFSNGQPDDWQVSGISGVMLTFKRQLRDASDDSFGYMFLRLPVSLVSAGKSLQLKMTAKDRSSDSWAMVFEVKVQNGGAVATCLPALTKQSHQQMLRVDYCHFGSPENVNIVVAGKRYKEKMKFGENSWFLPINEVKKSHQEKVSIFFKDHQTDVDVTLTPVRPWKVNFVEITHTDIGYTRPQADILADHVRFIDYALDYCDATDNYPDAAKFRWSCEGTWAVQEYFKSRPQEQIDRFIRRVREGRIELTAMYYNFDEIPSEQTLAASLYPLNIFKQKGIGNIEVASQDDVNGIGWCFNEYLPDAGVKYLTMGVNVARSVAPFDKPTFFWWLSPSNKKLLAFYGEHYMHGDGLGIIGHNFETFETKLLDYLNSLEVKQYPYDIFACEFLGIGGDNSAPSTFACDMVKQWNEKYEWPKLRLSLHKDYMSEVEKEYGKQIPMIKGAWPDWWTDGFASGAAETSAYRTTDASKIATQAGLSLAQMLGAQLPASAYTEMSGINDDLLFYGEHTYGADASIDKPFGKETMEQRCTKASFAWDGLRRERLLREMSLGFLGKYAPAVKEPSITVYNMSSWKRSGPVVANIDYTILPLGRDFYICDEQGNRINAQMTKSRYDAATWTLWVNDVPDFGYKRYTIHLTGKPMPATDNACADMKSIDTPWYTIAIDSIDGTLKSVFDKALNKDILATSPTWKGAQLIYEQAPNRSFDAGSLKCCTRQVPSDIKFTGVTRGDIWDTYSFRGHSDAGVGDGDNLTVDFLIYKLAKRIDVRYRLVKKLNTDPEAVYVAFPFELPQAKTCFDVPGGFVEAGKDQIQGTSNDWNTAQNFVSIRNDSGQIVWVSPETPLVELGDINIGRYKKESVPTSNHLFSYVMNNYWTTNFNADQHGEFEWTYHITSMADNSFDKALLFALDNRIPMFTRTQPASVHAQLSPAQQSFLTVEPQNVIVTNLSPIEGEKAMLVQVREMAGKEALLKIHSAAVNVKAIRSNILGTSLTNNMSIKPYETAFFKVSF